MQKKWNGNDYHNDNLHYNYEVSSLTRKLVIIKAFFCKTAFLPLPLSKSYSTYLDIQGWFL